MYHFDHTGSCRGQGRRWNYHQIRKDDPGYRFMRCPCCEEPPSCPICLVTFQQFQPWMMLLFSNIRLSRLGFSENLERRISYRINGMISHAFVTPFCTRTFLEAKADHLREEDVMADVQRLSEKKHVFLKSVILSLGLG